MRFFRLTRPTLCLFFFVHSALIESERTGRRERAATFLSILVFWVYVCVCVCRVGKWAHDCHDVQTVWTSTDDWPKQKRASYIYLYELYIKTWHANGCVDIAVGRRRHGGWLRVCAIRYVRHDRPYWKMLRVIVFSMRTKRLAGGKLCRLSAGAGALAIREPLCPSAWARRAQMRYAPTKWKQTRHDCEFSAPNVPLSGK